MADIEAQVREAEAINAAFEAHAYKLTRKAYYSKTGLSTPYKTYLDAKTLDKRITLELVRKWLREHIERTRQVGGARNSYVAPRAFHEYQADIFYITDRQFPNQDFPFGLSMIDVFSKYAVVTPLKERDAIHVMPAIYNGFKIIGKQPDDLYTDDEGALMQKEVAP